MSEPVTQAEMNAAIRSEVGPVRGKLDLLDQRVGGMEKAHTEHLREALDDRLELRDLRERSIRADATAEANGRWLKFLTTGSALGFVTLIAMLADILRRVGP